LNRDGTTRTVANKCDLCFGLDGGPACKRVCPTGALRLVERENIEEIIANKRQNTLNTMAAVNAS
ncbi:MAG: electron transport protein HydN, partial [Deltaproteobacteria bacterium]|nr:electron transport protein HydN [Deltaproteobacteria bacterium]